jgi:hypothetical protein
MSNYLEIAQILLLLVVLTISVKSLHKKPHVRNTPKIPGDEPRQKKIITPSGTSFIVRDKIKPKRITDEMIVEREQ